MILGTAAYMSPEQARGKPLDERTDIWSFGCVLYEALVGQPAFLGNTVSDILAGILTREPEWKHLPEETPANVRTLLRRCLRKEPHRRLRDIGDARIELEEALAGPVELEALPGARRSAGTGMLASAIAGLVIGALGAWLLARGSVGRRQSR